MKFCDPYKLEFILTVLIIIRKKSKCDNKILMEENTIILESLIVSKIFNLHFYIWICALLRYIIFYLSYEITKLFIVDEF